MMKLLAIVAATLAPQGCGHSYSVRAEMIDGRLAFVPAGDSPGCISIISVSATGPRAPDPAIDNLEDPVAKGEAVTRARAAWIADGVAYDCLAEFPVFYGSALPEIPVKVAPKKLRVGETYRVSVSGPEASGGDGCFRITRDGRVENLPDQKCTPIEPMPPQPAVPVVATITPVQARAAPALFVKPGDYPPQSLPQGKEASVRFVLDVRTDGWVSACTVTRSSGIGALDEATCKAMVARATFTPAITNTTFPVPSRIEQELTWTSAGPKIAAPPGNRAIGADLSMFDQARDIVRTTGRYATMRACQDELGRIAQRGPAGAERAFCFHAPATNYTSLQSKPPVPPGEEAARNRVRPKPSKPPLPPATARAQAPVVSQPKVENWGQGIAVNSSPPAPVIVTHAPPYRVNEPIMAIPQDGPGQADLSVWTAGSEDIPTLGRYESIPACRNAKARLKLRRDQRAYCTVAPVNHPDLGLH